MDTSTFAQTKTWSRFCTCFSSAGSLKKTATQGRITKWLCDNVRQGSFFVVPTIRRCKKILGAKKQTAWNVYTHQKKLRQQRNSEKKWNQGCIENRGVKNYFLNGVFHERYFFVHKMLMFFSHFRHLFLYDTLLCVIQVPCLNKLFFGVSVPFHIFNLYWVSLRFFLRFFLLFAPGSSYDTEIVPIKFFCFFFLFCSSCFFLRFHHKKYVFLF